MSTQRAIRLYVLIVASLSVATCTVAWYVRQPFPGVWAVASLLTVGFLLEATPTRLRVRAEGSTSFVIHLIAGILFGGFWGALLAGVSTGASQVAKGRSWERVAFNVAQHALAVSVAALLYQFAFLGNLPPSYLRPDATSVGAVQRDLFLFFVYSSIYLVTNLTAVSAAASISSNRPFREVWHLNCHGLIGYDLGASVIALMAAKFYTVADTYGYGPIALVLAVLPIVLVRRVYVMYRELQDSGQELLQVMVKAIEARDPYTSGHSLRVRELSRALALELQLPARQIEEVEAAAVLHDVGKIHEEFAPLLRKDSKLTPEETALMQTHAAKSAELVGIITKFRGSIQRAVRHHHERWDGEGYPDGIRGQNIPLGARIILIADTIDAMTTDRPYRKRLPLEVVIAELQKCRGTQFDPEVVDVAVSSVNVRRLIVGAAGDVVEEETAPRSRRVRISGPFWRVRRAQ